MKQKKKVRRGELMWKEVNLFIYLNIEMVIIAKGENNKKK